VLKTSWPQFFNTRRWSSELGIGEKKTVGQEGPVCPLKITRRAGTGPAVARMKGMLLNVTKVRVLWKLAADRNVSEEKKNFWKKCNCNATLKRKGAATKFRQKTHFPNNRHLNPDAGRRNFFQGPHFGHPWPKAYYCNLSVGALRMRNSPQTGGVWIITPIRVAQTSNNIVITALWLPLLLAATVWRFAHLPLGISDRNYTIVVCIFEGGAHHIGASPDAITNRTVLMQCLPRL